MSLTRRYRELPYKAFGSADRHLDSPQRERELTRMVVPNSVIAAIIEMAIGLLLCLFRAGA